jgi:hypothetical protein
MPRKGPRHAGRIEPQRERPYEHIKKSAGPTKDRLCEEGKKQNIHGRSSMTKQQLENALGRSGRASGKAASLEVVYGFDLIRLLRLPADARIEERPPADLSRCRSREGDQHDDRT